MSIDRIPAERMENGLYGKNIILDEPVYIEYNGGSISIVEVTVFYYDTINIQLFDEDEVGMKFCLVHRSFCSNERISQWDSEEYRLVIFPMLDKNADEIVHGQIVPYSLSFLNGYFIIDSERNIDINSIETNLPTNKVIRGITSKNFSIIQKKIQIHLPEIVNIIYPRKNKFK